MLIPTDLLKAALFCASTEETRYYLKGVHMSTSGHMVTTDGHRLFCAKLAEAVPADVIIPLDTVKAALKLAGKRAETIELNGNTLGGVVFTPVDGTFPDWRTRPTSHARRTVGTRLRPITAMAPSAEPGAATR